MGKSWTEKKYRCFVCEKWFTSAKQLQGHLEGRKHAKCLATLTPEQAKAAAFAQAEAAKPKPPPPPPPPVQILYRDEYYIAVNKPAGLIVHKSAFTPGEKDSLLDRLRAQFPDLAGVLRPCHRLDRRTSGVIVFALSAECSRRTTYMFTDKSALVVDGLQTKSQRQMRKLYVCNALHLTIHYPFSPTASSCNRRRDFLRTDTFALRVGSWKAKVARLTGL